MASCTEEERSRGGGEGRGESRKAVNEKPGFLARRGDNIHQLARHSRKVTCFKVAAARPKQDEPAITPPTPPGFFGGFLRATVGSRAQPFCKEWQQDGGEQIEAHGSLDIGSGAYIT